MTKRHAPKVRLRVIWERMSEQGYRQVNIWVPDTRSPAFMARCRKQSLLAARADAGEDILDDLDIAAGEVEGWR